MKISSWNVNSVRARIINILDYIKSSKPDLLMIQEIKTEEKNFPFIDFKNLGYDSYVSGQKGYNGVAFLSKIKIDKIDSNFVKDKSKQARIIVGDIKKKSEVVKLVNIYVPNGNPVDTNKYEFKKKGRNEDTRGALNERPAAHNDTFIMLVSRPAYTFVVSAPHLCKESSSRATHTYIIVRWAANAQRRMDDICLFVIL